MRKVAQTILLIVTLVAASLVVNQIPPLIRLTRYLAEHPEPYWTLAVGATALGWLLLMIMAGLLLWGRKNRPPIRSYRTGATFREIKVAFRSGAWWNDPAWSPLFIGLLATFFMSFGLLGLFIVTGPPLVKVICAGALIYAFVQIAWGFRQA